MRIAAGETYGLVGESGSGKTTTARLAVGMYRPDRVAITYRDRAGELHDVGRSGHRARRELRTRLAYVFQDPARSLNPRMRVESILLAGLRYTSSWRGLDDGRERALAALEAVGLAARHLSRRPPDFSGGQRHRPRPDRPARDHHLRRDRLRPRRVDPQPDPRPAVAPAPRAGPDPAVHLP